MSEFLTFKEDALQVIATSLGEYGDKLTLETTLYELDFDMVDFTSMLLSFESKYNVDLGVLDLDWLKHRWDKPDNKETIGDFLDRLEAAVTQMKAQQNVA